MASNKINIDKLSLKILENLEIYMSNTVETVEKAVKETAKETAQELRETSPEGPTKEYRKSWTFRRDPDLRGKWRFSMVVYSKAPDYRITHLLEKGFVHVGGGRVPGRPHIGPAEQHAEERLMQKLKAGLKE